MILEYAVDPALAARFENLRLIAELFDFSNPRRISRFPKSWQRVVYDLSREFGDKNQKMVEVKLAQISRDKRCLQKFSRPYIAEDGWPTNALAANLVTPFHGILCDENNDAFVASEDIDGSHAKFAVSLPIRMTKTLENFMQVLEPLLTTAKKFYFVDPYFRPGNRNCFELFNAIFTALNARPDADAIEINICTSCGEESPHRAGEEADIIRQLAANANLANLRPNTHVWLCADGMHARYLLTDIGAYVPDHSFNIDEHATLNISMMSREAADEILQQYFAEL